MHLGLKFQHPHTTRSATNNYFITFTKEVVFCHWDDTNITDRVTTKLGWRMGLSRAYTSLTFGVDLDKRDGSRNFI